MKSAASVLGFSAVLLNLSILGSCLSDRAAKLEVSQLGSAPKGEGPGLRLENAGPGDLHVEFQVSGPRGEPQILNMSNLTVPGLGGEGDLTSAQTLKILGP